MEIIDYNGTGFWSVDSIHQRYLTYARQLGLSSLVDLTPQVHEYHARCWIYPVMHQIIAGIEQGDKACIQIGVEFIEEDERFAFGKVLKSNTAKALRRADLTAEQIDRIRKRIVTMLLAEAIPREYREYAKLLRKVGLGEWWPAIQENANHQNPFVQRYYCYFNQYVNRDE